MSKQHPRATEIKLTGQLLRRALSKVRFGECWEWIGSCHAFGYGNFHIGNATLGAHRMMYRLTRGEITSGMHVCHHCDNPCCVRPSHLFLGTHNDNMADMAAKGRGSTLGAIKPAAGESHPFSRLTNADVLEIRKLGDSRKTPQKVLAERFGVSVSQIAHIVRRRAWKHI